MAKKIKINDDLRAELKAAATAAVGDVSADFIDGIVVGAHDNKIGFVVGLCRRGSRDMQQAVATWHDAAARVSRALARVCEAYGYNAEFKLGVKDDSSLRYVGHAKLARAA